MNNFQKTITDYICSGHTLLYVDTFEKDRAIADIIKITPDIGETGRKVYIWSISRGWTDINGRQPDKAPNRTAQPEQQLEAIFEFDQETIFILRDFGEYLWHETYPNHDIVIGILDDIRRIASSVYQTIIFVGPEFRVPKPLLHDITRIDFALPDNEHIHDRIKFVCSGVNQSIELDNKIIPKIIDACRGMTQSQITDRLALTLRKHKELNFDAVKTIIEEKAGVIRSSGLLTYVEPQDGGLNNVGGYEAIKRHVKLDQPCFTNEAREFGIEFPRGLMLVGIPGCGKTLLSTAIASELKLPLIAMDVGNLMDKYVGESENHMREALRMLESMAPCVLQVDEIEKGFGGTGDMDGGSSRRVFGTFIKWLNDRKSPIYTIATANQIQSLPPELTRKGRFDEIYGLDLPNEQERYEIFSIHLSKRNRNPSKFNIPDLAKNTSGYTGADIEQIVKLSLKLAFSEKTELSTEHLTTSISEIIPLCKTDGERLSIIRQWCAEHAKPANLTKNISSSRTNERKVTLN